MKGLFQCPLKGKGVHSSCGILLLIFYRFYCTKIVFYTDNQAEIFKYLLFIVTI